MLFRSSRFHFKLAGTMKNGFTVGSMQKLAGKTAIVKMCIRDRYMTIPYWITPEIPRKTRNPSMTFGAFAEIVPGVDGLIHISQIADHRIEKPGDVLAEGDKVDVKITDVDMENQKVSLSIRALLEEAPAGEDEE